MMTAQPQANWIDYVLLAFMIVAGVALVISEVRHWERARRRQRIYDRVTEADLYYRAKELRR